MLLFKAFVSKKYLFKNKKSSKRLGRGPGSGKGKTCGRGHKGQKSRSGYVRKFGFEGGQTPLYKRLPKFGFTSKKNILLKSLKLDNLYTLGKNYITLDVLKKSRLINKKILKVKILSPRNGYYKNGIILDGFSVSKKVKSGLQLFDGCILNEQ